MLTVKSVIPIDEKEDLACKAGIRISSLPSPPPKKNSQLLSLVLTLQLSWEMKQFPSVNIAAN